MAHNKKDLPPQIAGKLRQFKRLLMSYGDFKHARLAAEYILKEKLHAKYPDESYVTLPALNCSMIVAYCRPFSGNDARTVPKIPDLPKRFLKVLNKKERYVHEGVMYDRDKLLAHSDSAARDPEAVLLRLKGGLELVAPLSNWGLAPLKPHATAIFRSAAQKLLEAVIYARRDMEPELIPYLRVVTPERLYDRPKESKKTREPVRSPARKRPPR